jgi:hypothetical protein
LHACWRVRHDGLLPTEISCLLISGL